METENESHERLDLADFEDSSGDTLFAAIDVPRDRSIPFWIVYPDPLEPGYPIDIRKKRLFGDFQISRADLEKLIDHVSNLLENGAAAPAEV